MRKSFLLLVFLLFILWAYSQITNPYGFANPLRIPLLINGSFGELRGNHFHSGIDIKTEEREGLDILSAADGYVSRIRVSAWGFGKALYVTHPNGYTTVYGHLRDFNQVLNDYIRQQQYKAQSFEIDINLSEDQFQVKQGDVIAYSGNTGSSGGPHLHFEIRDTKTEKPMDPYLFGIKPIDDIPPLLKSITIYALDSASYNGSEKEKNHIALRKNSENIYVPVHTAPVDLSGRIGLGIELIDYIPGLSSKLGVSSITLKLNSTIIYHFDITSFAFDETRYINSHVDYEEKIRRGKIIQKSFIAPGNKLSVYVEKGNGVINPKPGEHLHFEYIVVDNAGNISIAELEANGVYTAKSSKSEFKKDCNQNKLFYYDKVNIFSASDVAVQIPAGALYDSLYFCYEVSADPGKYFSDVYFVHDKYTPVHSAYTLKIKPKDLPANLQNKAFIASIENGNLSYEGNTIENEFISAKVKKFGAFAIAVDTIAPTITPLNFKCNSSIRGKELRLKIGDNLSGVATYRGEINGQWVLFELDGKTGILSHQFTLPAEGKDHKLKLKVVDNLKNEKTFECSFRR